MVNDFVVKPDRRGRQVLVNTVSFHLNCEVFICTLEQWGLMHYDPASPFPMIYGQVKGYYGNAYG